MAEAKNRVLEDEVTRLSVVLRNSIVLVAAATILGGGGILGLLTGERWGDLVFGVALGLLIAGGLVGMDAIRLHGKDVPSLVGK